MPQVLWYHLETTQIPELPVLSQTSSEAILILTALSQVSHPQRLLQSQPLLTTAAQSHRQPVYQLEGRHLPGLL